MFKCFLCNNTSFRELKKFKNVPSNISKLLKIENFKLDKKTTVSLVICNKCNLIQLQNNILEREESYYDDYMMAVSHSSLMIELQKDQISKFLSEYNLKGKKILEVGSGDGHYSNLLQERGCHVTGIEPSKSFYSLAVKKYKHPHFVNDYLTNKSELKENYYDAWVARQVFEHLINPNDILQAIKLFIKDDAIGLIEVPSFEQTVKLNRYYDIFPDHVAYYTKETLNKLLIQNGFIIEQIAREANGEYLAAYIKNNITNKKDIDSFINKYQEYINNLMKTLAQLSKKYQKIGAWGAGGRGNTFYSIMEIDKSLIRYVLDSDLHKQGKYTVGSHLPILAPTNKNINNLDVIVITAIMYEKEILNILKKNNFKGKVLLIAPHSKLITV